MPARDYSFAPLPVDGHSRNKLLITGDSATLRFSFAFSDVNFTWSFVDNYAINTERVFITSNLASCRGIVDTPWVMDGSTLRDYATEAIRYWEPRRLFYNLFLVLVVAITFWLELPSSRAAITIDSILWLFLLAVVANVAYCAAYLVDLFVQASAFRSHWQQFRWLLFALGSAFAAVLTRYVSMTLFAAVAAGAK